MSRSEVAEKSTLKVFQYLLKVKVNAKSYSKNLIAAVVSFLKNFSLNHCDFSVFYLLPYK